MAFTASPKQLGFIRNLVTERVQTVKVEDVDLFMQTLEAQRLTKQGAGDLIDRLLATPRDPSGVTAGSDRTANSGVTTPGDRGNHPFNRFSGQCAECGHHVAAQVGTYRRNGSKFDTLHLPGQCPADVPAKPVDRRTWSEKVAEAVGDLPDGFYAVPSVTGSNDLSFFRIATNEGFYDKSRKGQRYVKQVVGGKKECRVDMEWIEKALAAVRELGIDDTQRLFGQELGYCGKCGRHLTDETSRKYGIGPDCRSM